MLATLCALALSAAELPPPRPPVAPAPDPGPRAAAAALSPFARGSLGTGLVAPALLLAGLGAAALLLSRRRARRERLVEIVETASLGPRRSLVVARLGGELLLLGSSEGGISLLTTAPAPSGARAREAPIAPPVAQASGLLARLRLVGRRAPPPAFDAAMAESLEDLELRRKLAAGRAGSVP